MAGPAPIPQAYLQVPSYSSLVLYLHLYVQGSGSSPISFICGCSQERGWGFPILSGIFGGGQAAETTTEGPTTTKVTATQTQYITKQHITKGIIPKGILLE